MTVMINVMIQIFVKMRSWLKIVAKLAGSWPNEYKLWYFDLTSSVNKGFITWENNLRCSFELAREAQEMTRIGPYNYYLSDS